MSKELFFHIHCRLQLTSIFQRILSIIIILFRIACRPMSHKTHSKRRTECVCVCEGKKGRERTVKQKEFDWNECCDVSVWNSFTNAMSHVKALANCVSQNVHCSEYLNVYEIVIRWLNWAVLLLVECLVNVRFKTASFDRWHSTIEGSNTIQPVNSL